MAAACMAGVAGCFFTEHPCRYSLGNWRASTSGIYARTAKRRTQLVQRAVAMACRYARSDMFDGNKYDVDVNLQSCTLSPYARVSASTLLREADQASVKAADLTESSLPLSSPSVSTDHFLRAHQF